MVVQKVTLKEHSFALSFRLYPLGGFVPVWLSLLCQRIQGFCDTIQQTAFRWSHALPWERSK